MDKWKAFSHEIIRMCWSGDVDSFDIQETAQKHGVIVQVPFNYDLHGVDDAETYGAQDGDPWFVLADTPEAAGTP